MSSPPPVDANLDLSALSCVDPSRRLTLGELQQAVWAADPAAFLIRPRILRRVIKRDRRLAGFGLQVPHGKSYVIGREPLLEIVDRAELGLADDAVLPEKVVLLARPDSHQLAALPAGDLLVDYWRLLFHARIHLALEDRVARGKLGAATVRQRIQRLGTTSFDEIRVVLSQDDLLLPPRSDGSTYAEFVALYLELRHFAGSFLPRYFPGLEDLEAVDEVVRQDVDGERLFQATRPLGAPDPADRCELTERAEGGGRKAEGGDDKSQIPNPKSQIPSPPSEAMYRRLMRKSQRPASLGNVVRAAIYRARALQHALPEFAPRVHAAIKMDVFRLVRRLQAALELDQSDPQPWQESLFALVSQTTRGVWTPEARLLYDLQKVCVDHEREIYTVDLVEWALSWGRRPIKRQLPNQRDVLMLKHLHSAAGRLAVVRLSDQQRRQLALLIHQSQQQVEARLREHLRPRIVAALDAVCLTPQNLPERVARKKLIEELLDQIGARGYLTIGNLRDAISRNNLKLPDLSRPLDFLRGDELLQANRQLALLLDGVYRRGEFYLRWMQRLSSLGFGTRLGRFLTRFAVVPFGGAYVTIAFVHHVSEWISGAAQDAAGADKGGVSAIASEVLPLGLLILCLFNSAAFRRALGRCFKASYQFFRAAVIEPVRWIVQSPLLQRILHSRLFRITIRFGAKPLVWTYIAWRLLPLDTGNWQLSGGTALSIFLAVNLLLNSRLGRNAEEVVIDWIVQGWHRFGLRWVMGVFWFVVDLFKAILEAVERAMYAVDEWLRFRSGESRAMLAIKATLGLFWFFVAYLLRFCVNVLVEPQLNPLKHFPVVTVGHKLLFPLYEPSNPLAKLLEIKLGLTQFSSWLVCVSVIWTIPGIFGFLVWELTANWRLYAANRRKNLGPVRIGAHGENMARLLKPGLHSGTLPKRYAKLRRAERRARVGGDWHAVRKHVEALDRIEASLRRWIQREFLELLAESRCWQAPPVTLEHVRLGTNSVRLGIGCPGIAEANLRIALEAEAGWLVAGVTEPGWTARLPPHQRQVLVTAIIGLYKSAGIELVRQQIEAQWAPAAPWYDISAEGLVLWPEEADDVEVLYDLHDGPWIAPQSLRGLPRQSLPTVQRQQLVFDDVPVSWDDWVATWNRDIAGHGHPAESAAAARVLPPE